MKFKKNLAFDVDYEVPKKLNWYYAPLFIAFWLVLYTSLSLTQVNRLPQPLSVSDEIKYPDSFIAERAERVLLDLTSIGPRVVGSVENEETTVNFLLHEVELIKANASDYFEFEVDVQVGSGNYVHWAMINMYQAVQNVVVKLSARNTNSENYLLINSHYDSVPGSTGAGDDGSMVSVMLEVMRVIAKSQGPLEHPIVFLFNGAEENPLQASHAFITQHKWAKNCKALINLDAAGNGGREVLFQSGPGHPWLMHYYRNVPHPFATTLGEEVFQAGFIPSDTDFRIFRDFGGVPGLDMAYIFNGYVYHTEYDRFNIVPRGSLQHTGDNVLVLAKSIGNAHEMRNTTLHAEGHVIFFDFLGWFMIFYTETTGIIINVIVLVFAFAAIGVSLYFMSVRSGLSWPAVLLRYGIMFGIQLLSLILGFGLCLLVAVFMDGVGRPMTWFSANWLIVGLYFCPMLFGMSILHALYLEKTKTDGLSLGFRIQLIMHAHCLCLMLIVIVTTCLSVRSSYMAMIAVFFDVAALIINLITKWHRKAYWFAIAVIVCQLMPFLYYTSNILAYYKTLIPMTGRAGSDDNPDLTIAALAGAFSIMFAGFIVPMFMFFRKTRTIALGFLAFTILSIIIAVTPAGFPYEPKTAAQRYALLHVHRKLHNADNSVRLDEAGIYVYPQDRRIDSADEYIRAIGEKHPVSDFCKDEMFCGMPVYNHRWHKAKERSYWIPIPEYPSVPSAYPELTLKSSLETSNGNKHFEFSLSGPDHMTLFIEPKDNAQVVNWSFNDTMLRHNWAPPYFIYYSYGKDNSSLEFSIDVRKHANLRNDPTLEIGIGGHWIHAGKNRRRHQFAEHIPDYWCVNDWVATYESWLF